MFKFSKDDSKDRIASFETLNKIILQNGGQPMPDADLPKVFQPIWDLIDQIQKSPKDVSNELMSKLSGLPTGRFFGKYVNQDGDEDPREYAYIMNFLFAMTCQKNDINCVFIRLIGQYKCVYGSMATPTLNWYQVLQTIFDYMNKHSDVYKIFGKEPFNTDPFPDFMNYPAIDNSCLNDFKQSNDSSWSTKRIVITILIALASLLILFNPLTFELTNKLGGITSTQSGPTNAGYFIHGVIFIGIVCLVVFLYK